MVVIGILMMIYVVPTLVSTFAEMNMDLPLGTKIIIAVSNFMTGHLILFLLSFAAFIFANISFFKSKMGKRFTDRAALKIPALSGLVKKFNSARTSRTLASLISSGVNIVDTISITSEVLQNHKYKEVLEKAKADVQKGTLVSVSFKNASDLYPPLVGEMMAVGEETGKLGDMLNRLADFYEEEVDVATKDLSTIIEPVLMIIIGVVVGFFAISMIKPMYSMTEGIR
jgi:type IV pilus assembly protein PilC